MRIDIVSDTICPWCYNGKRRLEKALGLRPGISVKATWRPFMLNPEMPPDGIDRTAYLMQKFGSEARIRRIYGAIAEAGQSVEIDFAFESIQKTPNTVNSHRLMRYAAAEGKADAVMEALFFAYFINGHNIGELDVLVDIGANIGLEAESLRDYLDGDDDVDAIYAENARAHRLGINGVPSFIFNDRLVTSGAQEPPVLARMLDAAEAAGEAA